MSRYFTNAIIDSETTNHNKKMTETYLGYQVRHLSDDTEKLNQWLKENPIFSVWGKTVVGSGCDYGVNPEHYPWHEIKNFKIDNEKQCSFCTESKYFVLTACELPSDRWGNTATFSSGLSGGIELGYSDNQYENFESLKTAIEANGFDAEIDEIHDFIDWLQENHPDIISTVGEKTASNEWCYYTTNTELDNPKWISLITEFFN